MPFANKLTIHIFAAVAEHEREFAVEKRSPVMSRHRRQGGGGSFYFFSILRPLGPTSMRMPSGCLRS